MARRDITSRIKGFVQNSDADVTIAVAGTTTLAEIDTIGISKILVEVFNRTGGGALDAFTIQGQAAPDAGATLSIPRTLASIATDYTAPAATDHVKIASGDLTVLAANASGFVELECQAYNKITILASANTSESTVGWSASGG